MQDMTQVQPGLQNYALCCMSRWRLKVRLHRSWRTAHCGDGSRLIKPPQGGDVEVNETFIGHIKGVPKKRGGQAHKNAVLLGSQLPRCGSDR
jgi:hypothetical protein